MQLLSQIQKKTRQVHYTQFQHDSHRKYYEKSCGVRATKCECSVDAKRSFYRVANSIFAKVRRLASEEVMVQLLKH